MHSIASASPLFVPTSPHFATSYHRYHRAVSSSRSSFTFQHRGPFDAASTLWPSDSTRTPSGCWPSAPARMLSSPGASPASSQPAQSQTQQPVSQSHPSARQNGSPSKLLTDSEDTDGVNRSTLSVLRRTDPVERRPELVGGVPLWLLIGAGEQLRKFAQLITNTSTHNATIAHTASDSTSTSAPADTSSLEISGAPPRAMPETLRLVAAQLEVELTDLRAELKEANQTLLARDEQIRIFEQQLADMSAALDSDKDDYQGEQQRELHATVQRLFKELCAAQTREAAMRQRVASIELLQRERDNAQQDIVKVLATVVLFIVLLGGRTAQYGGAWLDLILN